MLLTETESSAAVPACQNLNHTWHYEKFMQCAMFLNFHHLTTLMAGYIGLKVMQQELYCQNGGISQLNSTAG